MTSPVAPSQAEQACLRVSVVVVGETPRGNPRTHHFYTCPICEKSSNHRTNMQSHLNGHLGIKPFACTQCPRHFVQRNALQSHLATHGIGQLSYPCPHPHCGATLRNPSNRNRHVRTVHRASANS